MARDGGTRRRRLSLGDGRFKEPPTLLAAKSISAAGFSDVQRVLGHCILDFEELGFGNEEKVLTFGHLASFSNAGR